MLSSFSGENRLNIILAALLSISCQTCESVGGIRKTTGGGGSRRRKMSTHSLKLCTKFVPSSSKKGLGGRIKNTDILLAVYVNSLGDEG